MIMMMVGRWVRATFHAATCRLDAFTLVGHPNGVIFVVLASLLTLQALISIQRNGIQLGLHATLPYQ
jgi:hypothetical protein